jgi:CheY-like chemotaxis protein
MSTILIIDDEPEFLHNLAEILAMEDFDVITSSDGAQALERVHQYPVDLILCDMLMRPIDGMKILRAIRENANTSQIPFVFITGLKPDQIKSGVAEASGFLIKPFTNDMLLTAISEQLGI